jgi:selenium metabolism protein YedF
MRKNPKESDTVILINTNGMGKAEIELQHKLIGTYFKLINESDYLPAAICFYTEGVKLTVDGSPVLDELKTLEDKGVRLVICGTCLKHFDLQDKIQVGIPGGMPDIIEAQRRAKKVITL